MALPSQALPIIYTTLSFLSLVATVIPTLWHLRARNIPGLLLIFWVALGNLFNVINALIWSGDITNAWSGAILCDIQVKFLIATGAGQLGAATAIARKLTIVIEEITGIRKGRERNVVVELFICLAAPVSMILAHYIVQPNRYAIWETTGCAVTVDQSWLKVALVTFQGPVMSLVCAYYSCRVLIRFLQNRKHFNNIFSNATHSTMNKYRFKKLFALALVLTILVTPTAWYAFFMNINHSWERYSWSSTHSTQWNAVIRLQTNGAIKFDRWVPIGSGFLLFFFFGLGQDAMDMYRQWKHKIGQSGKWMRDSIIFSVVSRRSSVLSEADSFSSCEKWDGKSIMHSRADRRNMVAYEIHPVSIALPKPVLTLHNIRIPSATLSLDSFAFDWDSLPQCSADIFDDLYDEEGCIEGVGKA